MLNRHSCWFGMECLYKYIRAEGLGGGDASSSVCFHFMKMARGVFFRNFINIYVAPMIIKC